MNYNNTEDVQAMIREKGAPDSFTLQGMIFTMDNYDMDGKEITYGNIAQQKAVIVKTKNRYSNSKFTDAIVELEDSFYQRDDVIYIQ